MEICLLAGMVEYKVKSKLLAAVLMEGLIIFCC